MPRKSVKLNLGCGSNKLPGYVNIDVEESCKPDKVVNFIAEKLPFKDNSCDEVVMFHCIEHIPKVYHPHIVKEIHRVLKPRGRVYFSFPEFLRCVENWKKNYRGKRQFWEATLYGLQRYKSDFHVCIMDSTEFTIFLKQHGFKDVTAMPEPVESYNSMVQATKGNARIDYEAIIKKDMLRTRFRRVNVNHTRKS